MIDAAAGRRDRAARHSGLAVAAAVLASSGLVLNRQLVGVFYDDGVYASLGWALAHGWGYVHPNLPGAPAAVHFPPLYPLILAPLFGMLSVPTAGLAAKVINVMCAAAGYGLIAWHATRSELVGEGAPRWVPGTLVAAAAVAIPALTLLSALLSEPVFGLLVAAAVALADRPPARWAPRTAALAAGVVVALAVLQRTVGVAAAVGVVAWIVASHTRGAAPRPPREWRRGALALLPVAVAGAGWGAWVLAHQGAIDPLLAPDYGSYTELIREAGLGAVGARAIDLARPLAVLVFGWVPSTAVYYLCGIPALGVGGYGLWLLTRRSAVGVTLVVYLALLACWPVPPDRFLWAILPWLTLAWGAGAVALWRHARLRVPVAVLVALLSLGYARYEARGLAGGWWDLAGRRVSDDFTPVLPALDSLPREAVLATDHDPLVWLYTHRAAVPVYLYRLRGAAALEPPPAVHRAYLARQGVTYVLAAGGAAPEAREVQELRTAFPGWLVPVRSWPDGRVLLEVR